MKLPHYKIGVTFFTVGIILSILIAFVLYAFTYLQIGKTLKTSDRIMHSNAIIIELERILAHLNYAETSQRGFLITHDSAFYASFKETETKLEVCFHKLDSLFANDSAHAVELDYLHEIMDERYDLLNQNLQLSTDVEHISQSSIEKITYGAHLMRSSVALVNELITYQRLKSETWESIHRKQLVRTPVIYLTIGILSILLFTALFLKLNSDRKKLKRNNREITLINQTFNHAEQLADLGNWQLNLKDKTTTYSDNFYQILGLKPNEIELNLRKFLYFIHPDDRRLVITTYRDAYKKLKNFNITFRIITKQKRLRHFKSIGILITHNDIPDHFIGINMDITELVITNNLLELKNRKLEVYNADLASFNYVASHDLQAPLRKIQMFISRIRDIESGNLTEQGNEYFNRIHSSAAHMQSLINDLLLFSRTNVSNKRFEWVDLNLVLSHVKEELAIIIEEKEAVINIGPLPHIKAIPYQIQQLFVNLLSNSLKFIEPEKVPYIEVSSEIVSNKDIPSDEFFANESYYRIKVKDNGIGFEKEYTQRIFHLLFRLHDKTLFPGSGIGLAICKKIIDNHNGYIYAEAEAGKGAEFYLYFPQTD